MMEALKELTSSKTSNFRGWKCDTESKVTAVGQHEPLVGQHSSSGAIPSP